MKLIMENWRKWLRTAQDEQDEPEKGEEDPKILDQSEKEQEFRYMHNLFFEFIQNDLVDTDEPELLKILRDHARSRIRRLDGYYSEPNIWKKVHERMHKAWKWQFPYAPEERANLGTDREMNCVDKMAYLDRLSKSYFDHPKMMIEPGDLSEIVGSKVSSGPSPYEKCRGQSRVDTKIRSDTSHEMSKFKV